MDLCTVFVCSVLLLPRQFVCQNYLISLYLRSHFTLNSEGIVFLRYAKWSVSVLLAALKNAPKLQF